MFLPWPLVGPSVHASASRSTIAHTSLSGRSAPWANATPQCPRWTRRRAPRRGCRRRGPAPAPRPPGAGAAPRRAPRPGRSVQRRRPARRRSWDGALDAASRPRRRAVFKPRCSLAGHSTAEPAGGGQSDLRLRAGEAVDEPQPRRPGSPVAAARDRHVGTRGAQQLGDLAVAGGAPGVGPLLHLP